MLEPALDPLVERGTELSALETAVGCAGEGAGRLVVVEGPAGIGKTRLLRAARDLSAERGIRTLAARGTDFESHMAFGVVRQLLDPVVFALEEAEREALFVGAARLARAVFGEGELQQDTAGADRYAKLHGLFWLVSTLARSHTLAIVVDDVQWTDEPSLEFLCFLARRIEGLHVLVVAATRPAREAPTALPAALIAEPGAVVLRPAPLSRASVETLVDEAVGSGADPDFALACLEATRGNPFLLSELLREVSAARLAPTAREARRVGSLAPGGVSAVIELRLTRMPEGARPLAEAIAVLGDGVAGGAAARLAGLSDDTVGPAEAALVREGILESREGLRFTHPLVRATVLHGVSPTERGRLHAGAVALLAERGAQPEELATHLLHVEPAGEQASVASLRAAALRAGALGAPATAAAYLRRALAEPPASELRCEVLIELGRNEARAGIGDAIEHLRQAVSAAADPTMRARAALELARALKFGGHAVRAVDVLEALEPDLGTLDAELRELVELELIGLPYISEGSRSRLAGRIARLRDPGRLPTTRVEAFTLAGLAFDAAAGGLRPATEVAELAARAVSGDVIPNDPTAGGYGLVIAGVATMWADHLDDASHINARILEDARRQGSVVARSAVGSMQALVNWRRGRLPDAEADCSTALELADESDGTDALVNAARAVKALIALARGATPEELHRIECEVLDRTSDPDALPYHLVLHARGMVRIARGDADRGIEDLLECGRVSIGWGSGNPTTVSWRSDAALALARAGDREQATRLVAEELELARDFGALRAVGIAQRAQALVADDATTLPGLEQAVQTLEASPAQFVLAVAMTDLASVQRRDGLRSEARDTATRAQERALACGATVLVRRALEEALAAGARPRRVALRGVDSLTPSERRVAQRAAEGHTNREIAEDLFVTVKTVEMHLANAYGKLGIRSRTQLADALASENGAPPEVRGAPSSLSG